jgi:Zn-dependent peptidase ImmA (M78 family)
MVLDFFSHHRVLRTYETNLIQICNFLKRNHNVEFILGQDLGVNAHGREILGKFDPYPPRIHISLGMGYNSPRWRFTLAHEIGHLLLHRQIDISNLFDRAETGETIGWNNVDSSEKNIRIIEWQANSFASSLIMPTELLYYLVILCLKELGVNNYSHGIIYLDDQPCNKRSYYHILSRLNKEFNASFQSLSYRLAQLRLVNDRRGCTHIRDIINNLPLVNASKSECSFGPTANS